MPLFWAPRIGLETGTAYLAGIADDGRWVLTGLHDPSESLIAGVYMNIGVSPNSEGVGNAAGPPVPDGAATPEEDTRYREMAVANRRGRIHIVPGTGGIMGLAAFGDFIYAFRNSDADTGSIRRSYIDRPDSNLNWDPQPLGAVIPFDNGTREPRIFSSIGPRQNNAPGETFYLLRHIIVTNGDWSTNDAEGMLYIHFDPKNPAIADNDLLYEVGRGNGSFAQATGPIELITLNAVSDCISIRIHNFRGQAGGDVLIIADGVSACHILDGSVLIPVRTGQPQDTPSHVAIHANHLLLGFDGGSVIVSETGNPYGFDAAKGAAEIAVGDRITGMLEGVGVNETLILCERLVKVLYGTDAGDFVLRDLSGGDAGGLTGTLARIRDPVYMDDRGVRAVNTTDAYGNFVLGTLTQMVQPWLDDRTSNPVFALRLRAKAQYRLFWPDGMCLCIYLGRGRPEITVLRYPFMPTCGTVFDHDGRERVMVGSSDGFVYELDVGTSFDGAAIESHIRLPFVHPGGISRRKRWMRADVRGDAVGQASLSLSAEYGAGDAPPPPQLVASNPMTGSDFVWDESEWNRGYWDDASEDMWRFDLAGISTAVSLALHSSSAVERPHTLDSVTLHWSPRRER